jgi:hypothetical protein
MTDSYSSIHHGLAIEYPENYLAMFTLGYRAMKHNTTNDQLEQFHCLAMDSWRSGRRLKWNPAARKVES